MNKKVLHIINSPGLGGAETMVKDIVTNFPSHKIFCLRRDEKDRFISLGRRVMYGTKSKYYKINPAVFFKLFNHIKDYEIEIIHVHLASSLLYALLVRIFRPSTILIYHEHGEIVYGSLFYRLFLRLVKSKVNAYIAVSVYIQKRLSNLLRQKKETYI